MSTQELELLEQIDAVPEGEWIALSADERRLVAHHPELRRAVAMAKERGELDPVVMKSAAPGMHFIICSR